MDTATDSVTDTDSDTETAAKMDTNSQTRRKICRNRIRDRQQIQNTKSALDNRQQTRIQISDTNTRRQTTDYRCGARMTDTDTITDTVAEHRPQRMICGDRLQTQITDYRRQITDNRYR